MFRKTGKANIKSIIHTRRVLLDNLGPFMKDNTSPTLRHITYPNSLKLTVGDTK